MTLLISSKRLSGPTSVGASTLTLLTVPAGHRYVVKSAKAVNQGATAGLSFILYVNTSNAAHLVCNVPCPGSGMANVDPFRLTLEATDSVLVAGVVTGAITVTLDGFDFTV